MVIEIILVLSIILTGLILFLVLFLKNQFSKKNENKIETFEKRMLDFERRITDLMSGNLNNIKTDIYRSSERISVTKSEIEQKLLSIEKNLERVYSFQDLFKTPKLKGGWGEAHLEYILSQHYPKECYIIQYSFSTKDIVDAVFKLPNDKLLPIDSKFPVENFIKMTQSSSQEERDAFKKKFFEDIKKQIDEISSKYILPEENTIETAIMYIPAEALYYEIIHNSGRENIMEYAWSKKVVLASPNTLYLTLRVIENWFKEYKIAVQTKEIIKRLNAVYKDTEKLKEDFRKLGMHLKYASSSYDSSEKRLSLWENKVKTLIKTDENLKIEGDGKGKNKQ